MLRQIFTEDNLFHLVGGAAIAAFLIVCGIPETWAISALFWFGLLREMYQHAWHLPKTMHVWFEAVAWPIGALVAALAL
jgi:hypothetical protein